jgi:hypothetical protein
VSGLPPPWAYLCCKKDEQHGSGVQRAPVFADHFVNNDTRRLDIGHVLDMPQSRWAIQDLKSFGKYNKYSLDGLSSSILLLTKQLLCVCHGAQAMSMIGCAGPLRPSKIQMYHTLVAAPVFLAIRSYLYNRP